MPEHRNQSRTTDSDSIRNEVLVKILYDLGEGLSEFTEKSEFDLEKCLEIGTRGSLEDFYHRIFGNRTQVGLKLIAPWLKLIRHLEICSEKVQYIL